MSSFDEQGIYFNFDVSQGTFGLVNLTNGQHVYKLQLTGTFPDINDTYSTSKAWHLDIFPYKEYNKVYLVYGGTGSQFGIIIKINMITRDI